MYVVTCCNPKCEWRKEAVNELAALEHAREHQCFDYDCSIWLDGNLVGWKDGFIHNHKEHYVDAATQTGMYDAW